MKITIHDNGWTAFAEDVDLARVTQDEVDEIAKYISSNTLVIFKKQHLNVADQVRIGRMLGNLRDFNGIINNDQWRSERVKAMMVPGGGNCIQRVTGEKDHNGMPGLFSKSEELEWHNNNPNDATRAPIVWLYAVKGSASSITEWTNSIQLWKDLDQLAREKLQSLKFTAIGAKEARFFNGDKQHMLEHESDLITKYETPRSIVHTTEFGETGLFYPVLNIDKFIGHSQQETQELIEWINSIYLREPYIYAHHWEDGDCLLAEQWLAIHRRLAFKDIENRVLWRFTTDFSNTLGKR